MKTALLLSGEPRFCADFDVQLKNLANSEIHWYVALWKKDYTDAPGDYTHPTNLQSNYVDRFISPLWRNAHSLEETANIIRNRLPQGHFLSAVTLIDPDDFNKEVPQSELLGADSYPSRTLRQWYMVKKSWELLAENGGEYDLVLKSRPDLGLSPTVDLKSIYDSLIVKQNTLIGEWYKPRNPNDMWAIGLQKDMQTYCNVLDHLKGDLTDGEYAVWDVWRSKGLSVISNGITCSLRTKGTGDRNWAWHGQWWTDFGDWK